MRNVRRVRTRIRTRTRIRVRLIVLGVLFIATSAIALQRDASAQTPPNLAGKWALNRALSQWPREVGFDVDFRVPPMEGQEGGAQGRQGRRAPTRPMRPESEDEARRVRLLTDEIREPPASVTVAQTATDVTFSDDHGHSRTFHPNGKEEVIDLSGVATVAIARWEGGQLIVLYEVEQGRQLRYAFSRLAGPDRLAIEAQFIDHGKGDHVTRVYMPSDASASQPVTPPAAAAGQPPTQGAAPPPASPSDAVNSQPGAEFKGISTIGLVMEDLSPQSTRCGLTQTVLEGQVLKHLTDAGLHVRRNSDDDTYVYVNIKTATVGDGVCVSRYDVFLTTHTTATLSYQQSPVLVDVTLFHKGSLAGGSPGAQAESVQSGVLTYIDQITARIRDANK